MISGPAFSPPSRSLEWAKRVLRRVPGARLVGKQILTRYGQEARSLSRQAPLPSQVMLEPTSHCNLDCAKCGRRKSRREAGMMEPELAFALIDQAREAGIGYVCLSLLGEPLLHPEIARMVDHAAERRVRPYLVTNGLLLEAPLSRDLMAAGLHELIVSVDGWDRKSYAARQGGADLDRLLANLRAFRELRGQAPRPLLVCGTVVDRESVNHLAELRRRLGPFVDRFQLAPLTDFGDPDLPVAPQLLLGARSWKRRPCSNLWHVLSVGWDGRVSACCNDHNFRTAYHHVKTAGLAEIWNSETIQEWRTLHLRNRLEGMPLCAHCTYDYANSLAFQRLCDRFPQKMRTDPAPGPSLKGPELSPKE